MRASIRRATTNDITSMVEPLVQDTRTRSTLNPALWPVAADAVMRIQLAIRACLENVEASAKEIWLLAESGGRIVGMAHGMIVQPPPIYNIVEGPPGLLLDDSFTLQDAPPDTAPALLTAMETALRAAGASGLIASCPSGGAWQSMYDEHGYEPVTLYKAKSGFTARAIASNVRSAMVGDVAAISGLSAQHRRTLAALNSRFWQLHPEADARFEAWMRFSLTLADRDMLVAGERNAVSGYVIAQPIAPLLVPPAHDIAKIGVIDDFYSREFANTAALADEGSAAGLLHAAESAFAQRGVEIALVVCPAAWTSKDALLERQGYRTAKLWLLKR